MDSALQVAEEEVVESCSPTSKFEDIFRLLSEGCFPHSFCSIKRKNLKRYAQKFIVEGGCLYYVGPKKEEKREVVVDPERRRQVFLESHFSEIGNHLGQKKTVHRIQSRYYWLGIVKDVVDWIKMCETCQNTEHNKSLSKKTRPVKVESPWEVLGLDVYGPFPESVQGKTHILAVTDYYTKWVEAIPLQKRDALCVAKGLTSLFYRFGASKNIFCSLSWDFCEEVTRILSERWNISQILTPVNCTVLDSRTNELLKSSLCNVVNEKPSEWDESLDPILFDFRTSVSSVTKYTPFFLLYNRYVCLSSEAECIKDSSKEQGASPFQTSVLPSFTAAVQEQQNAVKEIVIANMAAAYKQEQKSMKRKTKGLSSLTYKMEDGVFDTHEDQALKKLKKNQFVSFQIETVLPPEQSIPSMKKTG
ncbi:gypsy retrotransposon integrase 1 [Podarcis lilfordi]|uniref:Gypsy retrotransposon integrase-like protein 1 n=1 Tax=Podarcis lilfordi TaxID=74358 RepID=A0AA35PTC1_9SAUR|nr:gypsy retrotransposon integrase 1 [Podarcis lilfordi]